MVCLLIRQRKKRWSGSGQSTGFTHYGNGQTTENNHWSRVPHLHRGCHFSHVQSHAEIPGDIPWNFPIFIQFIYMIYFILNFLLDFFKKCFSPSFCPSSTKKSKTTIEEYKQVSISIRSHGFVVARMLTLWWMPRSALKLIVLNRESLSSRKSPLWFSEISPEFSWVGNVWSHTAMAWTAKHWKFFPSTESCHKNGNLLARGRYRESGGLERYSVVFLS